MAFTDPRTWVTDELVTAAMMNAHIRDNFNAVPHLVARKTSDQTVTSSTTLANDTALVLAVGANDVWHFRLCLVFSGATNPGDLKVAFTFPAGGEIAASTVWGQPGGGYTEHRWTGTTTPTTHQNIQITETASARNFLPIEGVFINSSTAGNLQLQFAQTVSTATGTTMRANSTLWGMQLA